MYIVNENFRITVEMIINFLKDKYIEKTDLLTMEVIMMSIDWLTIMINSD